MKRSFDVSGATLHVLAMLFMLLDHLWATVIPGQAWLTCVGRLAFPMFAFLAVEGYVHTHSFRRYMKRLLVFALLSEIPFNLMYSNQMVYPFHQNVIWTLMLGLLGIWMIQRVKEKGVLWKTVLISGVVLFLGWGLGTVLMVDYYGAGVLTVLAFYFFRGTGWQHCLGQAAALFWINVILIGGLYYPVQIGPLEIHVVQQGFALLALIPIWLYQGRQGYHSKGFQYACYAFYPVHMLLLSILGNLV